MDRIEDQVLQAQDEERQFFRCVELAQMAQRGERFSATDVQDLIYHLGVRNYFSGEKAWQK